MYAFDALSPVTRATYVSKVEADLAKARELARDSYVVATVAMTTFCAPWQVADGEAVATSQGTRRPSNGEAAACLWAALSPLGPVRQVDVPAGYALGAEVATSLFLVRPASSP